MEEGIAIPTEQALSRCDGDIAAFVFAALNINGAHFADVRLGFDVYL